MTSQWTIRGYITYRTERCCPNILNWSYGNQEMPFIYAVHIWVCGNCFPCPACWVWEFSPSILIGATEWCVVIFTKSLCPGSYGSTKLLTLCGHRLVSMGPNNFCPNHFVPVVQTPTLASELLASVQIQSIDVVSNSPEDTPCQCIVTKWLFDTSIFNFDTNTDDSGTERELTSAWHLPYFKV